MVAGTRRRVQPAPIGSVRRSSTCVLARSADVGDSGTGPGWRKLERVAFMVCRMGLGAGYGRGEGRSLAGVVWRWRVAEMATVPHSWAGDAQALDGGERALLYRSERTRVWRAGLRGQAGARIYKEALGPSAMAR